MTSKPDESPNSPRNPSPAGSSSASSHDWVLVIARILFLLACVLIVMPMYELLQMSEQVLMNINIDLDALDDVGASNDVDALNVRHNAYLVAGFCLMMVSAVVAGVRQFKLQPDQALVASRLLDVPQFGAMSLNDIQKMGGKKRLFAWLWDCVSMIAGVFFFALVACALCNTQPIFAAVALTMAVLFPSLIKSSRRTREVIFGVPSRDELQNKHGD